MGAGLSAAVQPCPRTHGAGLGDAAGRGAAAISSWQRGLFCGGERGGLEPADAFSHFAQRWGGGSPCLQMYSLR